MSEPHGKVNVSGTPGWREAIEYHERTKHHFNRFAPSLGYLDWKNQPDPFRRFAGAAIVPLLLAREDPQVLYDELFGKRDRPPASLNLGSISLLFELSLAISAWKEFRGSRWALRINPSSGNLHPTEGYLLIGPTPGICDASALFHYAANDHVLEQRATFATEAWQKLTRDLPVGTFFVALTSIHWREAWKYGERAYRYCQHDAGHAIAAVALSAAIQGWRTNMVGSLADDDLEKLLGLDRAEDFADAEREHPDCLLMVTTQNRLESAAAEPAGPQPHELIAGAKWLGRANRLSAEHVVWEIIDSTARACRKPKTSAVAKAAIADFGDPISPASDRPPAARVIRQRRSALDFDGKTPITAQAFYLMLDRLLPRFDRPPWSTLGPPACVHLGLFVHLVTGLPPGLYFLVRDRDEQEALVLATHRSFAWAKPPGAPPHLPLFQLVEGDARRAAGQVSCGQDIAADSAFSLGMIARFEEPLHEHGGWFYRRLHWEAGVIGQVLYLEAEAAGLRATGIGCFFDDPVHELLGLNGREYQTIYHFTVGRQIEDLRLMTWPPYSPEVRARGE